MNRNNLNNGNCNQENTSHHSSNSSACNGNVPNYSQNASMCSSNEAEGSHPLGKSDEHSVRPKTQRRQSMLSQSGHNVLRNDATDGRTDMTSFRRHHRTSSHDSSMVSLT